MEPVADDGNDKPVSEPLPGGDVDPYASSDPAPGGGGDDFFDQHFGDPPEPLTADGIIPEDPITGGSGAGGFPEDPITGGTGDGVSPEDPMTGGMADGGMGENPSSGGDSLGDGLSNVTEPFSNTFDFQTTPIDEVPQTPLIQDGFNMGLDFGEKEVEVQKHQEQLYDDYIDTLKGEEELNEYMEEKKAEEEKKSSRKTSKKKGKGKNK